MKLSLAGYGKKVKMSEKSLAGYRERVKMSEFPRYRSISLIKACTITVYFGGGMRVVLNK
jgi:hypothetical protein